MKYLILIASLFSFALTLTSLSAIAQTQTQASFTEINDLKWSQVLPRQYQNLDLDGTHPINGIIQKSEATIACENLGAGWHLPTEDQFRILGENYQKIPGMEKQWFWSSSVNSNDLPDAFGFFGYLGYAFHYVSRYYRSAVVCVSK